MDSAHDRKQFRSGGKYAFYVVCRYVLLRPQAAHIANMFREDPSVVALRETGQQGRLGVLTTHKRKVAICLIG